MTLSKIAVASLLAILTAHCCAAGESKLDLIYKPAVQNDKKSAQVQPTSAQMQARVGACTVVVNTPVDVRKNKETLGTTFRDSPVVSGQSPTAWLETALLGLKAQGFNIVPGKADGNPPASRTATISTDLNKLYIWYHSMNMYATLVVNAKIQSSTGETLEKKYRVNGTKLNWWNADAELVETLNLAADRVVGQIAGDLDGLCGSKAGI